jgi:peptide-methionine (S)-S-oxide reductase
MIDDEQFDAIFYKAVTAIDDGDEARLKKILDANPELVYRRLYKPGTWLTSVIGDAVKTFFNDPYLLWFVSEDAIRNGRLPANIVTIASIIIEKIKAVQPTTLQEQLDYTLKLVAWSVIARKAGVQLQLLDLLVNEGAARNGVTDDALVNGNSEAAEFLIKKGADVTLPTALVLNKSEMAEKFATTSSKETLQFSLVLAALNGNSNAVKHAISLGANVNAKSNQLYSHGTPLHHAAASGSLETVKALVAAGADLNARDTVYNGTPEGWAEYGNKKEVADYLKKAK